MRRASSARVISHVDRAVFVSVHELAAEEVLDELAAEEVGDGRLAAHRRFGSFGVPTLEPNSHKPRRYRGSFTSRNTFTCS